MARFSVYQDPQSEFRWKLLSNDERTLAKSNEGFKSREACVASVSVVKQEVATATLEPVVSKPATTNPAMAGASPSPASAPSTTTPANSPASGTAGMPTKS